MKPKLITRQPKRLFTFGCSFTGYAWMTWAEVVAKDLDIPFYNYGESGAGNQYIYYMFMQAHRHYQFNSDDLIMICWTNVTREDRYLKGKWWTPGTIHLNGIYDESYIEKFVDPLGYLIRDLALIDSVDTIASSTSCQFHMFSMNNFTESSAQFWNDPFKELEKVEQCRVFYKGLLYKLRPSFYTVLWNNSMDYKIQLERQQFGPHFADRHPDPKEHLLYLTHIFDHDWKTETKVSVDNVYDIWYNLCYAGSRHKQFLVYRQEPDAFKDFTTKCRLVNSLPVFQL